MSKRNVYMSLTISAITVIGCAEEAEPLAEEDATATTALQVGGREYGNCSQAEIHNIQVRMAEASYIADETAAHWRDPSYEAYYPPAKPWFGTYGSDQVNNVIQSIATLARTGSSFLFWCNPPKPAVGATNSLYNPACGDNEWIARQVSFGSTPAIVLCQEYWKLSEQEKPFSLLHEISHVAGTDDITYDWGTARALDRNSKADNAYNYEQYYRELF